MSTYTLNKAALYTGSLILVNARYQYRVEEQANLVPITQKAEAVRLNRQAAALLSELMGKIRGWNQIVPVSGWRSRKEQQSIWNDSLEQSGEAFTKKFVAVPGHSEHETGLAIDLGIKKEEIDFICPEFPYEGICERFRENAASYGFIERYPAGKEAVTGIGHEPWHFRYVGVPHACIMKENNLTLEEYMEALKDYPYGKRPLSYRNHGLEVVVSYLQASRKEVTTFEMDAEFPTSVSGNNVDGFVLTEWRGTHGNRQKARRA